MNNKKKNKKNKVTRKIIDKTNKLVYFKGEGVKLMKLITLEAARINIGYTQHEAAEKFGINYQTLAKLEKDSSNAPYSFIKKVPKVYGISDDNIFFGVTNEFIRSKRDEIKED